MHHALRTTTLLIGSTALLMGCHKSPFASGPKGHVRLKVEATWQGQLLQAGAVHMNVTNYRTEVELLKVYLAEMRLTGPSGSSALSDIDLFDALDGGETKVYQAVEGLYSGMHFGLGVPPLLNASDPVLYPVGHPLSVSNGTYWTWATGYRFVMFDGRYDTDPNGTGMPLSPFSIHTGMDPCYRVRNVAFGAPFGVVAGDTTDLTVRFEVDRFFHSGLDTLDLALDNQSHGENLALAQRLTDLVLNSITVE